MGSKKGKKKGKIKVPKVSVPQPVPVTKERQWLSFLPMIILFAAAVLIYWRSTDYGYVLDDTLVIIDNKYVQEGFEGIRDIFTTESFQGYFGEQKFLLQGARYRPLSIVTFAIENGLWGENTFLSHLINVLLYAFCCLLLFVVLKLLLPLDTSDRWYIGIPFIAALLYTLHPLHVETVANIKGRDELMAFILSFASLWAALKYCDTKKILYLALMSVSIFLGLLAKENTITFLAVIPVSLFLFRKTSQKQLLIVTGILLLVIFLYLIMRVNIIGYLMSSGKEIKDIMNNPFIDMSSSERYATVSYILGEYLCLNFFPHPLTHDYYPYHVPKMQWSQLGAIWPVIVHIALGIIAIWGILKKKKIIPYCIIFYFATISIVCNLFINVGTFMNERFMFMSSVAVCLFLAYLISNLHGRGKTMRLLSYLLLGILVIGFSVRSWTRVPVWKDALSLNSAAVKVSKNSARSNSFMATALFNRAIEISDREEKIKMFKDAEVYALRAVDILPYYKNANIMKVGVASELWKINRDQTALLKIFKDVCRYRPDVEFITEFLNYINGRTNNVDELLNFYFDTGYNLLFKERKNSNWAIHYLKIGHNLDKSHKGINEALANIYTSLGDNNSANFHRQQLSR